MAPLTLFISPGTCSLFTHIVFRELSIDFELSVVDITKTYGFPQNLAHLNPKRRFPLLVLTDDSTIITETVAVATYADRIRPGSGIFGRSELEVARAYEWLNWLSGTIHERGFGALFSPGNYTGDQQGHEGVRIKARKWIAECFGQVEERLSASESGWAVGEAYTVADVFLYVEYRWGTMIGFDMQKTFPAFTRLVEKVIQREAVKKAVEIEGIPIIFDDRGGDFAKKLGVEDPEPSSLSTAQATDTDVDVPSDKPHFVPLESNPVVLTTLLHTLGLDPSLALHDIYSLTDPDLLSFVPRPCYALLLVFPVTKTYESHRKSEDASLFPTSTSPPSSAPLWFPQTIGNACGLMGLLHMAAALDQAHVTPGSTLAKFLAQARSTPDSAARASLIEHSHALASAHASAGKQGDTAAPDAHDSVDLHYVAFVLKDGAVWEMDGRRKGPIQRGSVGAGEDALAEKALDVGVRAFLRREEEGEGGDLRFSLLGLAPGLD